MSEQFKSIETTELVKIANAIRTKTGTTDKISLEDMPAKIAAIESSGDTSVEDGLVTGTITEFSNNRVASVGSYAFAYCSRLTSVSFPAATTIAGCAFLLCSRLTSVSFPAATTIGGYAFQRCSSLTSVNFPKVTMISNSAFQSCSSLTTLYLTGSSLCSLTASTAFTGTGIRSNKGYIYVPSSLVASYKAATNWAFFSNRIYSYLG